MPTWNSTRSQYMVSSLEKAFAILDLFHDHEQLNAAGIAKALGTTHDSIFRLLHTLEKHRYLSRDSQKCYSLGLGFLEKANLVLRRMDLLEQARPILKNLSLKHRVNTHLAIRDGFQLMYLYREEVYPGALTADALGLLAPLHCTALGKALLAHESEDYLRDYLDAVPLTKYTKHTITDRQELVQKLLAIRERGHAEDLEEYFIGTVCTASIVKRFGGEVIASISLALPAARLAEIRLDDLSREIVRAADSISAALGFEKKTGG